MGISPISNLIPLPMTREIREDLELLPMQRVENSPRTNDETYSPSNGKSAGGSESDASTDEPEEAAAELEDPTSENSQPSAISFFA